MKNTRMSTSNKVLVILGITTAIFIVAMIVIFYIKGEVPDTLIERYFTCVVGEGGFIMIIKVVKTFIGRDKGNDTSDEDKIVWTDDETSY